MTQHFANGHQHDHAHSHQHQHESGSGKLSERDKLRKMIEHWIEHNVEHAQSFEQWAERARDMGESEVSELLRRATRDMIQVNGSFDKALTLLAD